MKCCLLHFSSRCVSLRPMRSIHTLGQAYGLTIGEKQRNYLSSWDGWLSSQMAGNVSGYHP